MKRLKKKLCLTSAMALACLGTACFSSCSTDFWTIDDIATTSSTFYIIGYFEGFNKGVEESEVELKTQSLLKNWWNSILGKETPNEETPNEGEGSTESETPGSEEGNE